jgi:hypothetical protein
MLITLAAILAWLKNPIRCFQLHPHTPDAPICHQMLPDAPRCSQMLPDASDAPRYSRCFQMLPDASRCSQMLPESSQTPPDDPDALRCSQMLPDASRCYQMHQIIIICNFVKSDISYILSHTICNMLCIPLIGKISNTIKKRFRHRIDIATAHGRAAAVPLLQPISQRKHIQIHTYMYMSIYTKNI